MTIELKYLLKWNEWVIDRDQNVFDYDASQVVGPVYLSQHSVNSKYGRDSCLGAFMGTEENT